jgi:branched-chain amino acid transport system substrate-binding protein
MTTHFKKLTLSFRVARQLSIASLILSTLVVLPSYAQVKVAYIDPLSGSFANVGDDGLKHFREIADFINQRGGVNGQKLEIVPFDNKASPQESLVALKSATDQGIRFITQGNGSGAATALIDSINKWNSRNPDKSVLFLNYAAVDPSLTNEKCSFWHFRFDSHVGMKIAAITNYIKTQKNIKKVFILGQNYVFGQQVSKYSKEMLAEKRPDIKIVGDDLHPMGSVKDFSPYVAKIKASGADTIITGNWGNDMSLLLKAAKEAGLQAKFFTFYGGGLGTPGTVGAAAEDKLIQVIEWHANQQPNGLEQYYLNFNKKYKDLDFYYARINTEMEMLADAMNKAKSSDPKAVALALEDMQFKSGYGLVYMRKSDHQLVQPLSLSVFTKQGTPGVKYEVEKTGYGFKTIANMSWQEADQPNSCVMERP